MGTSASHARSRFFDDADRRNVSANGRRSGAIWFYIGYARAYQNPMAKDRVIRLRHTIYPLDLIKTADRHEAEVLARRIIVPFAQTSVWVATAEDLILLKLKASRDHDFEDARSIVDDKAHILILTISGHGPINSASKEN